MVTPEDLESEIPMEDLSPLKVPSFDVPPELEAGIEGYKECSYNKCTGYGFIIQEQPDGYDKVIACPCSKENDRNKLLGERFGNVSLKEIKPRTPKQAALKKILLAKPTTSVFIHSKGGTGKTHFLAAMYKHYDELGKKSKYFDDGILKDELRQAELEKNTNYFYDVVRDYNAFFIDDVGKTVMTEFHRGALYRFFNEIYKRQTPKGGKYLFITANDPLSVLGGPEYWGPATARRVEDICEIVDF